MKSIHKVSKARYCILDANKSSFITIKLYIDRELAAGADFRLYDEGEKEKEGWKLSVDDGNYKLKTMKTSMLQLHKHSLVWQVLVCGLKKEGGTDGSVKIEVLQSDEPCKMTMPAECKFNNVPPCKMDLPEKYNGALVFIIRKD